MVEGNEILRGIDLTVNAGEVHTIMGPNGSGKSTLASVLAGKQDYEVTEGTVSFEGKDLLELKDEIGKAENRKAQLEGKLESLNENYYKGRL